MPIPEGSDTADVIGAAAEDPTPEEVSEGHADYVVSAADARPVTGTEMPAE